MGGTSYDSYVGFTGNVGRSKIENDSAEAGLVISMLEAGAGMNEAAVLVNEHRSKQAPGPHAESISWSAVQNWVSKNPAAIVSRRLTK
jgi:hypothetical protein